MALSMTGYGSVESAIGERTARAEIRAVNHRFLNLSIRLPGELACHEAALRKLLRDRFSRGHLTVVIGWIADDGQNPDAGIDFAQAVVAKEALGRLCQQLDLVESISIEQVLAFPDVLGSRNSSTAMPPVEWPQLHPVVEQAIEACIESRRREGAELAADLAQHLDSLGRLAAAVEELLPARLEHEMNRLRDAVAALTGGIDLDQARFAQEVALIADRVDVSEELVRMRVHLGAARETLGSAGPVGKRLGFLAQEMGREINTIGSKANDATVAQHVVAMKGELEQVREQLENLE